MSGYTFSMIGLGALTWVAIGVATLDFGLLVDNEPITPRDVLVACTLEPLLALLVLVAVGLCGLVGLGRRCFRPIKRKSRAIAIAPDISGDHPVVTKEDCLIY